MINASCNFDPAILPTGKGLKTQILIRLRFSRGEASPTNLPESPRRNLNLSLAIDRSGSMAGSPLHHALKAAESIVDQLAANDTFSIVTYDDSIDTVVPPQSVTDKNALKAAIRRIRAGGLTNLSGGWLKGCEHVKAHLDPQRIDRVLLLTDGHANVGINNPTVLMTTAGQKAEEGISTTTLGFGQGFNEDLLIGMARAGNGNFYFIQSMDEASEVFGIELDSLRAVVGQNLAVTIELAPGVSLVDTLSLAQVSHNDAGATLLTLGDLYEGEDKLLGLSLNIANAPIGQMAVMKLHYTADIVQNGAIQTVSGSTEMFATVGSIEESANSASSDVLLELSHLTIAKAKEIALTLAEQGNRTAAEQTLRAVIKDLIDRGLNENFEIAEEIEQLEYFATRIAQGGLGNAGRKELLDQSYQTLSRNRSDLAGRGTTAGDEVSALPTTIEVGTAIELHCVREGGKLRIKVISDGFDSTKNVQFPRAIRAEGARYTVEELKLADGGFYRVEGKISRLTKPGEVDIFATGSSYSRSVATGKASKGTATAADLPTTDIVGDGVLVQCVKDGSKLRARVVADGYEPDWNMRFPRSVREEGMLYVVDEIKTAPDGKSYIACGEVKRFVQPVIAA
jgi:Ca-activated chloride channel homolog